MPEAPELRQAHDAGEADPRQEQNSGDTRPLSEHDHRRLLKAASLSIRFWFIFPFRLRWATGIRPRPQFLVAVSNGLSNPNWLWHLAFVRPAPESSGGNLHEFCCLWCC